jgi:hypothetical protein
MTKKTGIQLPSICPVSQMADAVGLTRQRFYQLIADGVFPPPVYDLKTQRPYYSPDQQQQCMGIRQSGIGFNGQMVFFNRARKRSRKQDRVIPAVDHYIRSLKRIGVKSDARKIQAALKAIYPKGLEGRSDDIILRDLTRYLTEGTIPDVQSQ